MIITIFQEEEGGVFSASSAAPWPAGQPPLLVTEQSCCILTWYLVRIERTDLSASWPWRSLASRRGAAGDDGWIIVRVRLITCHEVMKVGNGSAAAQVLPCWLRDYCWG